VLVEETGIVPQRRIFDQCMQVAFEVLVIDGIKSYQRREEPDIRFSQVIAYEEALFPEPLLQPIQGSEDITESSFVCLLRRGEPAR